MRKKSRVSSIAPSPVLDLKTSATLCVSSGMPDPSSTPSESFQKSNLLPFHGNEGMELRVHISGAPTLLLGDAADALNMAQVNGYFKEQSPQEGPQRAGRVASMTRTGMQIPTVARPLLIEWHSYIPRTFALPRYYDLVFRYRTCEHRKVGKSHRKTTRRYRSITSREAGAENAP
jgi:hypothetical protein